MIIKALCTCTEATCHQKYMSEVPLYELPVVSEVPLYDFSVVSEVPLYEKIIEAIERR